MSFSSGSHAPGAPPEEGKVMEEVQATLRLQYIQEFYQYGDLAGGICCIPLGAVQTVRDHCFKLCITSPGSSLSSSEQKCLGRCMDRYQDATGVVTKAVLGMQGMQ